MRVACLIALSLATSGCAFFAPLPRQLWIDQYRGLSNLPDENARLTALAQLTTSAAYDGDTAAVKRFLKDFRDDARHDTLAAKCSEQLSSKDLAGAESVAESIENPEQRAEVLAKLRSKSGS